MLTSAITALVFVGLLVTGVYVANIQEPSDTSERQTPLLDKNFFADLDALADVDKSGSSPKDARSGSLPQSLLNYLEKQQAEKRIKPSMIFKDTPTQPQVSEPAPPAFPSPTPSIPPPDDFGLDDLDSLLDSALGGLGDFDDFDDIDF